VEIFRTQRPEILKYIAPHIVEGPDYDKVTIINIILSYMLEDPESICVVVIIDGDKLVGYTIGWIIRDHVWLDQSYLDVNCDRDIGKQTVQVVKDWALEKDIHDIRFETTRSAKALTKAWGFEEFSSIMRMEF